MARSTEHRELEQAKMNHQADDLVKSCEKLESGLLFGYEGIGACCMGPIVSPLYWSAEEASRTGITKEMIIEKRKWLFQLLNDNRSDISCKRCDWVVTKRHGDVCFTKLGHLNLAHSTVCNLRCGFCGFTKANHFEAAKYDPLPILREFSAEDVEWDSYVDLNGGEPSLLPDLEEYLDYFASRGTRILLYTNAVRFHQSIYDGLVKGTITWVITSLDAGTPSSFRNLKGRDHFIQVMENLSRYASAGSRGGGMLAVKYVFCDTNCTDDDIAGFSYAMLAIRPQKVWLTFDFIPLGQKPGDQDEVAAHDYSRHIQAYAKMFLFLKKHGLEAVHFSKTHLATVFQAGRDLLEDALQKIDEAAPKMHSLNDKSLFLKDFRNGEVPVFRKPMRFDFGPLTIKIPGQAPKPWPLAGKRVLLAPACRSSTDLLSDPAIRESRLLGFLDRNPVLHGKSIEGFGIHGYEVIPDLAPDVILVASPDQHRDDILATIAKYTGDSVQIAILDRQ